MLDLRALTPERKARALTIGAWAGCLYLAGISIYDRTFIPFGLFAALYVALGVATFTLGKISSHLSKKLEGYRLQNAHLRGRSTAPDVGQEDRN